MPVAEVKTLDTLPGLGERLRRHRNTLIFAAVALLVVATVVFRARRARLQELPGIAERGLTQGLDALDEGRFDTALQLLSEARDAVDQLGSGFDPGKASAIRQGAHEVEIFSRLAPATLKEMLDEATRSDAKDWAATFDRLYKGRTILIDDEIAEVPDGQGRGRYELHFRILPPGEGVRPRSVGLIDTKGFKLFEITQPKVGYRVTFGAKLASFQYDLESEVWLVGLMPDSGVSITHHKALKAIGMSTEQDEPARGDLP
jgi:hypothetical protein